MEKTYRFVRRFNPLILLGVVLVPAALVAGAGIRPGDPVSIAAALLVLGLVAFMLYRQKAGLQRLLDRRLKLDDKGLRYEISSQSYSVAWSECDHYVLRLGRDGQPRGLTLVTRDGRWLQLARFEDMPGILATVRQHVPTNGARGWPERLLLDPGFSYPLMAVGWAGCLLFIFPVLFPALPWDQAKDLGLVLLAPSALATFYMWQHDPLMKLGRAVQQGPGSPGRRFMINLGVWLAIVVVVLVVLNFMNPPK